MRRRAHRGGRSAATIGLVTAAALGLLLVGPPGLDAPGPGPAGAQEARPDAALTLTALTRVLGPGTARDADDPNGEIRFAEELRLRVLVENTGGVPLTAAQLVIEVHPATLTRGLLANAFDGRLPGPALHVHAFPLVGDGPDDGADAALAPGAVVGLADTFTAADVAWAGDTGGVHPVRIAVTLGTEILDEHVTAVVWLNERPATPLLATLVWPIDTAPWRGPGGVYPLSVDREVRPGSRLDRLIGAVERGPATAPVVLAPAAHLLEDLSDRSDGYLTLVRAEEGAIESRSVAASDPGAAEASVMLRRLRELAGSTPLSPVSASYADADLPALLSGDAVHAELAALAAAEGRRRVQLLLGVEVDGASHLVNDALDRDALDVIPGESVLLPATVLDLPPLGTDPDLGQPVRTLRAPSGRLVTAVLADPYLDEALARLDHPAGTLAASQRVLAETAMAYLTAPAVADRALLMIPDRTWDPPGAAAEDLLLALGEASWLRLLPASTLATQAQRSLGSVPFRDPPPGGLPDPLGVELSTAWRGLAAATGAVPAGTTRLQDRPVEQLRDDLLRATSAWFRGPREVDATALVRDVRRTVDATFGTIEVATDPVTLTSDAGQIPVTLQRTRGGPVVVLVAVQSQGRLLWPEGRVSELIELEEGSVRTVSFATRAVSTGTFPVTVVVTDPSGTEELARDTLSVRSTAISRPALTATAALVVVLLLVGALRRRAEPPRLEVVRDTDTGSAPPLGPGEPR